VVQAAVYMPVQKKLKNTAAKTAGGKHMGSFLLGLYGCGDK
jgi:hypothetical protein